MKTEDFLRKYYNKDIEDYGGVVSPEYKQFAKDYKNILRGIVKKINFNLYKFNNNHYTFSAILQDIDGKFYYISISDVRYFKNEWADNILYRTMKHDKDWTGGSNHYTTLSELKDNLLCLQRHYI